MRKAAVTIGAVVVSLLLLTTGYLVTVAGNDSTGYDYTIQTSGTPGLKITGTCTVTTASGPVVKDFSGPVGRVEHVKGTGVACHLHKTQQEGALKLIISQDGNILSESESIGGGTSDIDASVSVT